MSLYHLLPPLFRWEDIPDPFEELIHPLDSDTPEDLTPVLLPFTSEQSKTKDSSKDGISLLEADVMDDFSPVLQPEDVGDNSFLPDSQSVTIFVTANGDYSADFFKDKDLSEADQNSNIQPTNPLKVQVKPRRILKNIVLARFCIDPHTDRPSSCVEEEELDDSGPKSNERKESDDNNSAITESTAPDSIEVPSVVLPTSDISQGSNTSLTTPTAPDSSVEQSQTIFFIIPRNQKSLVNTSHVLHHLYLTTDFIATIATTT